MEKEKTKEFEERLELPSLVRITEAEVPFAPKNQLGEYEIKRWTWFQKSKATEAGTTEIDRAKGIVKWDISNYYLYMLYFSVKKVPPEVNWSLEFIQNELDPDIGDILTRACLNVNSPSKGEKETFLGRLSSGAPILGLTSIGPAEPSVSSQKKEA